MMKITDRLGVAEAWLSEIADDGRLDNAVWWIFAALSAVIVIMLWPDIVRAFSHPAQYPDDPFCAFKHAAKCLTSEAPVV